jgi:acetylornithine deacetylase/succinyl-diaminopimelate desuccinylase-like protein
MPSSELLTRIDGMESELVKLTLDLLRVRSISPDAEYKEIVRVLNDVYASLGLEVKWMTASEDQVVKKTGFAKYPRHNILGRLKGSGGGPSLAIFSHMDTVDAADLDAWKSDPYVPELTGGKIFGLGAMDARCDLACAFFAAKALKESGIRLKGNLIIIGVVDDEVVFDDLGWPGTPYLVEEGHVASGFGVPDYVINGEGSGLETVVDSFKGRYTFEITLKGRRAHAGTSYGVNAVESGFLFVNAIKSMELKESRLMGKDLVTIFSFLGGNEGAIDIPNSCTIGVDIRFGAGFGRDRAKRFVQGQIEGLREKYPSSFEVTGIRVIHDWEPSENPATDPLTKAIENAGSNIGIKIKRSGLFGAGQNLPYIQRGIPCVTYGAGSFDRAHGPNEFVAVEELLAQTKVYAQTTLELCGSS